MSSNDIFLYTWRALAPAEFVTPKTEVVFHPFRKWRFDVAWRTYRVAVEIEGGVYTRGRHTRPVGFLNDVEKYNAATSYGWLVFRTTPDILQSTPGLLMAPLLRAIQSRQHLNPYRYPQPAYNVIVKTDGVWETYDYHGARVETHKLLRESKAYAQAHYDAVARRGFNPLYRETQSLRARLIGDYAQIYWYGTD